MVDSITMHKQLTYEEKNRLMKLIPQKNHWRKREQSFSNGSVKLSMFIREEFYYLRINVYSVSDFLDVEQITNSNYDLMIQKLNYVLGQYDLNVVEFDLREIHYKLDIRVTQLEMIEYLQCISKCKSKFYNTEKVIFYDNERITGIKFKPRGKKKDSKECSYESTVYNKDYEMTIKPHKFKEHLKDTLRFEIKIKKRVLDTYKRRYGVEKSLYNYFDAGMREIFFQEYLVKRFIYSGDYYSINSIKNKLNPDENLSKKIIKMIKDIKKYDIDYVYKNLSNATINKYFRNLMDKNINPIPLNSLGYLLGIKTLLTQKPIEI